MKVVYITIGNTDNKLTQQEWSALISEMSVMLSGCVNITHFAGFSAPDKPWQNACWCVEISHIDDTSKYIKGRLRHLAKKYKQDGIAWADATVEMIPPGDR